ncbi:MAG: hypothetical protein ACOY3Y_05555 [Acidobacteriota bacterium]
MKRLTVLAVTMVLAALPLASDNALAGCAKAAAAKASCPAAMEGVERSVANLENGVRVTMNANDAKAIAALQERVAAGPAEECRACPMHAEGVTRTVEKTASGVVVTATSANADTVKSLQAHAASMTSGSGCGGAKAASCCGKNKGQAPART